MDNSLFNFLEAETLKHNDDPYTSREAALKSLENAKGLNKAILDELGQVYPKGLTDEQLAIRLNVDSTVTGNNVAKRRSALTQKGLIVKEGVSQNKSGNRVTVWKLYFPPNERVSKWGP